MAENPKDRLRWEVDTKKTIQAWPEEVRANIGGDLRRLQNFEEPLDSRPTQPQIPGANELRDRKGHNWYRLVYWLRDKWIYVIHCFEKDGATIPDNVAKTANKRMQNIVSRKDAPYEDTKDGSEKEQKQKSA
jgi:phage-related protein